MQVKLLDNQYLILVKEYPNIDRLSFKNNERLKDEDLSLLLHSLNSKIKSVLHKSFYKRNKNTYDLLGSIM